MPALRTCARLPLLAAASVLAACSGGGSGSVSPAPAAAPAASAVPTAPATTIPSQAGAVDDWTMYAHDSARTGFQAQATGLSPATVASLTLRWTKNLGEGIKASPIVAGGSVYVAGLGGTVRALSAATGATLWQQSVAGDVQMTPTLSSGVLFVGTHTAPGLLVAFDAASGSRLWTVSLPGAIRSEPVVLNGTVYVGDASGDPPTCNRGALHGISIATGAVVSTWYDSPQTRGGGGIWTPISTDGQALYVGTGNACVPVAPLANAVVKLSAGGTVAWSYGTTNVQSDDDVGSAVLLSGSDAIASDKNGFLYDFDAASGALRWSAKLGPTDGYGATGSASTDGRTIVTDGGYISDPTVTGNGPGALIYGLDRSGSVLWKFQSDDEDRGNIPIAGGVAFAAIDESLVAIDARAGTRLWSHALGSATYASPAIVPSGVYVAVDNGDVSAFALPAQAAQSRR